MRRFACALLFFVAVSTINNAQASNIRRRPKRLNPSVAQYIGSPSMDGTFGLASLPDNWLGGTGNWSNGADWSAGLPGSNSDVLINTGNDNVTLDTNANINSLTLGGDSGYMTSSLVGDGNGHTVNIASTLTVKNPSGYLALNGDVYTVHGNAAINAIVYLIGGRAYCQRQRSDFLNGISFWQAI